MKKIYDCGIVPVVVVKDKKDAVPTANALLAGGVDVMEITFRTDAAAYSIRTVADNCPDMLVGAGTVVNLEQCKEALDAGAKFIVAPGFDPEVVEYCVNNNIPVVPGCVTPTEIMAAMKYGIKVFKFFPAGIYGGMKAIKAIAGPFADAKFIPTGGVNAENLAEFASSKSIYAVGGTWICTEKDISAGNYERITQLCKEARQIIAKAREA